jgi:hypothetical protein
MSPFVHNGIHIDSKALIKDLGDFSAIRSPAKYAARIGQVFTDTPKEILIDRKAIIRVPDIERNGRVFSDGCSIISPVMLERIQNEYSSENGPKPTLFQIRLGGKS